MGPEDEILNGYEKGYVSSSAWFLPEVQVCKVVGVNLELTLANVLVFVTSTTKTHTVKFGKCLDLLSI